MLPYCGVRHHFLTSGDGIRPVRPPGPKRGGGRRSQSSVQRPGRHRRARRRKLQRAWRKPRTPRGADAKPHTGHNSAALSASQTVFLLGSTVDTAFRAVRNLSVRWHCTDTGASEGCSVRTTSSTCCPLSREQQDECCVFNGLDESSIHGTHTVSLCIFCWKRWERNLWFVKVDNVVMSGGQKVHEPIISA